VDLIPIGEAARKLGVSASALRYYDERGLLRPAARRGGRRVYGADELRRLAFIHIAQRLGISLDTTAAGWWPA
jgi:DNA-binding transcriptional MerR regulator